MNDQELTHISLFSGIGGFDIAGEWAGFRTVVFCEKEPFCQEILKEKFGAVIADPNQSGLQIGEMFKQNIQQERSSIIGNAWQENWYEVATRFCGIHDGLPSWIHSDRVKRLKTLGNAIVPQIAYEIMKRIAWIERDGN